VNKVIEIQNLQKGFGQAPILKNLNMHLNENENLVVLGKSGTGKSVLIKCIVRLLTPESGHIHVYGQNVHNLSDGDLTELRAKIGFLFQSGALYDSMTIRENLAFPLRRIKKNLTEKQIDEKIEQTLQNVGLLDAINKMPAQLSGGMRKRASLARTIVVDPKIMLYDEPTTGLDPITSYEISLLINSIKKDYNTSAIIITHDLSCARTTADRLIMLDQGYVHMEGSLDDFENSADALVRSFFIRHHKPKTTAPLI
jgi:phospholipid/cholesterol/gamma-HCH transport system ATP-binding protein